MGLRGLRVEQNGMVYDEGDDKCRLYLQETHATGSVQGYMIIAFVQCFDESTQMRKRYFGVYTHEDPEGSIRHIMDVGGKWHMPFRDLKI